MNLHPIIVHFPVVLLSIYCILEVVTSFFYKDHAQLLRVKKRSLWIGTVTLFPSFASGEAAEDILGKSQLIHLHEEFAEMMRNLFVVLSLISLCNNTSITQSLGTIGNYLYLISQQAKKRYILTVLAVRGFVMMAGVGALGGAITRGTDHDPIAQWIIEQVQNNTNDTN